MQLAKPDPVFLVVKNFASGNLGIKLDDAPVSVPAAPVGGREIRGDLAPKQFLIPVFSPTTPPPELPAGYSWYHLVHLPLTRVQPAGSWMEEPATPGCQ